MPVIVVLAAMRVSVVAHLLVVAPLMPLMSLVPVSILIAERDVAEIQTDANATDMNADIVGACRKCESQSCTGESDGNDRSIESPVHDCSFQIAGDRAVRDPGQLCVKSRLMRFGYAEE